MLTQRTRGAFSLLEVIATLAVLSLLAGAVVPSLVSYERKQGVIATAATMDTLASAIAAMKASPISRYPMRLSHLGSPIKGTGNLATSDTTSCTIFSPSGTPVPYATANANNWANNTKGGPYIARVIASTGLPTPLGTIIDTLYRSSANNAAGFLPMIIRHVPTDDADELNAVEDGDANNPDGSNSTNTIQWSAPVGGYVDVKYMIAIAKTC